MGLINHVMRQSNGNQELSPSFLAETRQPQILIGNIIVQAVGSLFFFARAYSRVAIIKAWRAEDYVLTLAWIFCTGYSVCQYGQLDNGAGRHALAISLESPRAPVTSQQYAYAAEILLMPALALSKMSICLTYLRIFYADTRGRYMIKALLVLLTLLTFPFMIQVAFQCRPIQVYWTEGRPATKCLHDLPGLILNGSLNVFVDAALMAIVLPRVLQLQLPQRQKWALMSIILLGSLAVAAGIVRMVRVTTLLASPTFEPSWDTYDVSIWTATEIYVSLLCASAPGVKPVVVKILPRILGSSFSRGRTRATGEQSTGIELGAGSRWKRTTIGSARMGSKRPGEGTLGVAEGPYTEVGSGVDEFSAKSERPMTAGSHIYKTSDVSVQDHAV